MISSTSGAMQAIGIGVSDMKKSVDFYTRALGMKEMQTFDLPHMLEIIVGYESRGSCAIALMHYTDGSNPNYKNNPVKLVMYTDDPKALAANIKACGYEVTREPEPIELPGGVSLVVGFALDPDGYTIEILQRPAS